MGAQITGWARPETAASSRADRARRPASGYSRPARDQSTGTIAETASCGGPEGSDFNLFSDDKRVINLDAEIADRTFHSRVRIWIWSFVRIDQACLASSGGLAPTSFPLFQAMRFGGNRIEFLFCTVILLGCGGRP